MNELLQLVESLISYIELNAPNLNARTQQELGNFLLEIMTFIEEFGQQNPVERLQPTPQQQPELTEAMPSSNVESFGYDPKNQRLLVRFLGKHPNKNGPIYGYQGVPQNIFEIFRKGAIPAKTDGKNKWGRWWKGKFPSMGAAMYHMIRAGGYPHQRLS